ncbi:hypothetical protein N5P37_009322 [Trichoderma harzianum]|uniref:Cyclase n=1 Tax=Trichoderma harzianum CBS 226.95 TaxID=983964 RepID=A0A2T4A8C5_TRIHA|nr:hypothetical protein M431DRAFT_6845 [Trichoderma harzianum CBS 226.95]KAK0758024.1 hypothetical protein N5P37_009322 [Trichoderma harzianum]PKK46475.1 hypothetical protein CI102_8570 [Trichoderma harzianum]PTB53296.1 hypothetical protein M431DRAFT_6845 [Trichoderma harzianum CBS 226.95]
MVSIDKYSFPVFDDLPSVPGQPQGCLWGFFDKDGNKDELGTLNLLNADTVRNASLEIQTGKHVQLDWPMNNLEFPGFGRIPIEHNVKQMASEGFLGLDDEIKINTQTSSQWDSLKHWSIQKQGLFYNGLSIQDALKSPRNGFHNVCERGGIVARGVLVDWLRWWEYHNPGKEPPSAISPYAIPVSELEEVLKFQGTECHQGDVLIVRTGFVRWHNQADKSTRALGTKQQHYMIGVANNMETVRWLYSKHFSAVAGDTMGWEAWPYPEHCCLHEWLLCQWGTPIGELWNLEQLSVVCEELKRWSFFLTSAPIHVIGAVGSPPCVIAVF